MKLITKNNKYFQHIQRGAWIGEASKIKTKRTY